MYHQHDLNTNFSLALICYASLYLFFSCIDDFHSSGPSKSGDSDDAERERRIVPFAKRSKASHKAVTPGKRHSTLKLRKNALFPLKLRKLSLLQLAAAKKFQAVANRTAKLRGRKRKRELTATDGNGRNALHIVCSYESAWIYVLRDLIDASKEMNINMAGSIDHKGSTPLHTLFQHGSPSEEAVQMLVQAYPEALAICDNEGRMPLHLAIENNLSWGGLNIIFSYIEQFPEISEGILKPSNPFIPVSRQDGDKPSRSIRRLTRKATSYLKAKINTTLDVASESTESTMDGSCDMKFKLLNDFFQLTSSLDDVHTSYTFEIGAKTRTPLYKAWENMVSMAEKSEFKAKGKLWDKAMLLLNKAYSHIHPDADFEPLIAILEFRSYLPFSSTDFYFTFAQERIIAGRGQDSDLSIEEEAKSVQRSYDDQMFLARQLLKNHVLLKEEAIMEKSPIKGNSHALQMVDTQDACTGTSSVGADQATRPLEKNLLNLARFEQWRDLAKYALLCPHRLRDSDKDGLIPLHYACRSSSIDFYVIKALVDADPFTATMVDDEGSTPLHFLLHSGRRTNKVLRFLINTYPGAIAHRDNFGRTPLFHAIEMNLDICVIKTILEYPGAADSILQYCGSPKFDSEEEYRDPAASRGNILHQSVHGAFSEIRSQRTPLFIAWRNASSLCDSRTKWKHWEVALLLLKTAYCYRHHDPVYYPLHSFIEFLPYLPSMIMTRFVFKLMENDELMKSEDREGRLPLHVAVAAEIVDQKLMDLIELFVDHNVDAFKQTTKCGRTPLHEAAAAGKSCDICKKLIKLSPVALETRTRDGDLPFMLSACNEEKRNEPNLATVYTLIRESPGLISNQFA